MYNDNYNYRSPLSSTLRRERNGKRLSQIIVVITILFFIHIFFDNTILQKVSQTVTNFNPYTTKENKKDERGEEEEGVYQGRYPNSLLTLFYPYTLLSDVVLDQPINTTDIPFFWHVHKSDELIMKQVLTNCLGLELVELNDLQSIKKAQETNLVSNLNRFRHVITSPYIRETATIFTIDHFARMLCFYRHPLDYDIDPALPTFEGKDNWLTRYLSDAHALPLTFKELGVAKHVVRQTCVVGTLEKMRGSIIRMKDYFGWNYTNGMNNYEGDKCIDDALVNNPKETYIVDHESKEWHDFYKMNRYDCELYELAQSTWRAHIQTMIPYQLQLKRQREKGQK